MGDNAERTIDGGFGELGEVAVGELGSERSVVGGGGGHGIVELSGSIVEHVRVLKERAEGDGGVEVETGSLDWRTRRGEDDCRA